MRNYYQRSHSRVARHALTLLILLVISASAVAQVTLSKNLLITQQSDVEDFLSDPAGYTRIDGNIIIDRAAPITTLSGMSRVTELTGDFIIRNYTATDNVNPLDSFAFPEVNNLIIGEPNKENSFPDDLGLFLLSNSTITTINGNLVIENNVNLQSVDLSALSTVSGNVLIKDSPNLTALGTTSLVTETFIVNGTLEIDNTGFTDLSSFPNNVIIGTDLIIRNNGSFTKIGTPTIQDTIYGNLIFDNNASLDSLGVTDPGFEAGLSTLDYVKGDIILTDLPNLLSLDGFESLDSAAALTINTTGITDLDSLGALTALTNTLTIQNNPSLADCSQLPCQVTVGGTLFNTNNPAVLISNNTGNCADKLAVRNDPAVNSLTCVQAVLPIELTAFSAAYNDHHVLVSWETAGETDNSHFFVERSTNGTAFSVIGRVEGAGTTNMAHRYDYADYAMSSGINYYRLRQVDYDGAESVSAVVALEVSAAARAFTTFPNPVSEGHPLTVRYGASLDRGVITAELLSADGRLVGRSERSTFGEIIVPTTDLRAGLYLLRISDGSRTQTERVIIR